MVLRHSYAPGSFDPPDARLDDCATQRNLDETGRAQADLTAEACASAGLVPEIVADDDLGATVVVGLREP